MSGKAIRELIRLQRDRIAAILAAEVYNMPARRRRYKYKFLYAELIPVWPGTYEGIA